MRGVIQKWGNSLGVRLPKKLAQEVGINNKSGVDISVDDGKILIEPKQTRKKYKLKNLLSNISSKNLHKETDFGDIEGREIW